LGADGVPYGVERNGGYKWNANASTPKKDAKVDALGVGHSGRDVDPEKKPKHLLGVFANKKHLDSDRNGIDGKFILVARRYIGPDFFLQERSRLKYILVLGFQLYLELTRLYLEVEFFPNQ